MNASGKIDMISQHVPDYEKGREFSFVKLVFRYKNRVFTKIVKDYRVPYEKRLIDRDGGLVLSEEVISELG